MERDRSDGVTIALSVGADRGDHEQRGGAWLDETHGYDPLPPKSRRGAAETATCCRSIPIHEYRVPGNAVNDKLLTIVKDPRGGEAGSDGSRGPRATAKELLGTSKSNNCLAAASWSSLTETQPDGTIFQYGPVSSDVAPLLYIQNAAGARWMVTYDSSSRVQSVTDPFARRTTMAYDPVSGMITSIQDSFGRLTTISVNGSGDLSQIMTPDLCISSLVYDGSHQMIGLINPLGDRTTYSYLTGAVVRTQSPMGYVGSVIYHNRTPPPPFFAAPGAPTALARRGPVRASGSLPPCSANPRNYTTTQVFNQTGGKTSATDGAIAWRGGLVLPVRRVGVDEAIGKQLCVCDGHLPVRFLW